MGFSVFDLVAKITLNTVEYNKSLGEAEKNFSGLGEKISGIGKGIMDGLATAGKAVAIGIGAATTAVGGFAAASVKTGATFDTSMAQVAATMGKTVDEIQDLRDYALEMGSKTAFSASQAADALNYMALAGYDSEKSMQMLPNVLNLAAAGAMDLASASDMVTDAQSALGLNMEETTQLVDKMAKASSKSNTSVAQLGSAILTIGGTAKNLSGGTTELAQALGLLADNGIKGAEGGTALRNILLNLTPQSKEAAKAMEQIGLQAYDSEGKMRPLKDIFTDLNKGMEGMTDEEKTNILSNIFNKVDLKSVNALLATNVERWDELSTAIDNASGSAEAMANTQLDNLEGDITLFKSALEGAQIAISDRLTPSLRDFVQFGTEGVSKLSDAFKDGGLSGAMDVFGNLLSEGLNMIISKLPQAVDAGVQLLGAITKGIIDNIPTLGNAAIQIVQMLGQKLIENLPMIAEGLKSIGGQIISFITDGFNENQTEIISGIQNLASIIVECITNAPENFLAIGRSIINFISDGMESDSSSLLKAVGSAVENILFAIAETLPNFLKAGAQMIEELAYGMADNFPKVAETAIETIAKFIEGLSDPDVITKLILCVAGIITTIVMSILDNLDKIIEAGVKLILALVQGIINATPQLLAMIATILGKLFMTIVENYPKFFEGGAQVIGKIVEGIASVAQHLLNKADELMKGFGETVRSYGGQLYERGVDLVQSIGEGIGSIIDSARDWGRDLIDNFIQGIQDMWDNAVSVVEDFASSIADYLAFSEPKKGPLSNFHTYAPDMMQLFAEGIKNSEGVVQSQVKKSFDLKNMIVNGENSQRISQSEKASAIPSAPTGTLQGFVQNLTFNSPQALDPSEIARQTRNATRNMILQLRMA